MARPKDEKKVGVGGGEKLRHNPFAALASKVPDAPSMPAADAPAADAPTKTPEPRAPKSRGRLVLRRETKHRGGKTVVVVTGFALGGDASEVDALASKLKRSLGCGGTVEPGPTGPVIVVQGDRPANVAELLRGEGYRVDGVTS